MGRKRIYVTRKIPAELIQPYQNLVDIRMWEKEEEPVPRDVLKEEMKHADGLVSLITEKVDRELLENAPHLKVVANMAVGYDNVDVTTAKNLGITVTNTPDVLTETTADLAFSLMMATARRIVEASAYMKADKWKNWSPFLLAGNDIHHKKLGIVGMGRIGTEIARRAKGFNMDIMYHNRSRHLQTEQELQAEYTDFDTLLKESDYIMSVVPLTQETGKLFDRSAFQRMQESAVFINISRGRVVDEQALYQALKAKEIHAAGLDVYNQEPVGASNPLLELDNTVCLPHIGSASVETRREMIRLAMENATLVLQGEQPVTPV